MIYDKDRLSYAEWIPKPKRISVDPQKRRKHHLLTTYILDFLNMSTPLICISKTRVAMDYLTVDMAVHIVNSSQELLIGLCCDAFLEK